LTVAVSAAVISGCTVAGMDLVPAAITRPVEAAAEAALAHARIGDDADDLPVSSRDIGKGICEPFDFGRATHELREAAGA
jgi:hypothetical protein